MNSYYVCLVIFSLVAYLIVTDESVSKAIVYVSEILRHKLIVFQWKLRYHPQMPWVRYLTHRRSLKMAKELLKELENGRKAMD